jgi:hypothetical protein
MDDLDRITTALMTGALAVALLMLCHIVKGLQEDVELLRVTAAVPEIERHS